jgi:hypothetical protein
VESNDVRRLFGRRIALDESGHSLANCPAPVSLKLEEAFYPKASTIARAALATLGDDPARVGALAREDHFKGPY